VSAVSHREHIEQLARELAIELIYVELPGDEWSSRYREAFLAPWGAWENDEIQYGIALHEFGHIVLAHEKGEPSLAEFTAEFDRETAASTWALEHALPELLTPAVTSTLLHSLTSRLDLYELDVTPAAAELARRVGLEGYEASTFARFLSSSEILEAAGAWIRLATEAGLEVSA
jgi:hypothetical protein